MLVLCPIAKAIIASLLPLLRWNQIKWGKKGQVPVLLGWGAFCDVREFVSWNISKMWQRDKTCIYIYKSWNCCCQPNLQQINPEESCGISRSHRVLVILGQEKHRLECALRVMVASEGPCPGLWSSDDALEVRIANLGGWNGNIHLGETNLTVGLKIVHRSIFPIILYDMKLCKLCKL